MGEGGNLQITGGDVVDAYWRSGRADELVAVLRFANSQGLVPMLMTHGQILLDHPDYLARLVSDGGLRKLSVHIDITMAGRPGYPITALSHERQLNPLRDRFVSLVMDTRRITGKSLVVAQTVTVTRRNIDSIAEIIHWLFGAVSRLDACRTISFQPEASVGRSVVSNELVTPDEVWAAITGAVGVHLPRDHLLVGHPDCSSIATLLVRPSDGAVCSLDSRTPAGLRFWSALLHTFGGLSASSTRPVRSALEKLAALILRPAVLVAAIRFFRSLRTTNKLPSGFASGLLNGTVRGVNLVMHNFMSGEDVNGTRSARTQQRLASCAFMGVVQENGRWKSVSMCEMNAGIRPKMYSKNLESHHTKNTIRVRLNR